MVSNCYDGSVLLSVAGTACNFYFGHQIDWSSVNIFTTDKASNPHTIFPVAPTIEQSPSPLTQRTGIRGYLGNFLTASISDELECALVFVETSEHPRSDGRAPADCRRAELTILGRWIFLVPRDTANQ